MHSHVSLVYLHCICLARLTWNLQDSDQSEAHHFCSCTLYTVPVPIRWTGLLDWTRSQTDKYAHAQSVSQLPYTCSSSVCPLVKSTMSGQICGTGTFSSPIVVANDSDSKSEAEWPESDDAILAANLELGWPESDNETRLQRKQYPCKFVDLCWRWFALTTIGMSTRMVEWMTVFNHLLQHDCQSYTSVTTGLYLYLCRNIMELLVHGNTQDLIHSCIEPRWKMVMFVLKNVHQVQEAVMCCIFTVFIVYTLLTVISSAWLLFLYGEYTLILWILSTAHTCTYTHTLTHTRTRTHTHTKNMRTTHNQKHKRTNH